MKILVDNRINPKIQYVFLHIPKCGGTYAKQVIEDFISDHKQDEDSFYSPPTNFHQPFNSIKGYTTTGVTMAPGTEWDIDDAPACNHVTACAVRDPFDWYDSWFYFKKDYANRKRHDFDSQSLLNPLESVSGDYSEAIRNSLDDKYVKSIAHSTLQGGFCPYVWMSEFDIGFYTAWFLYMVGDHKLMFDNSNKIRREGLSENLEYIRHKFDKIWFYDINHSNENIKNSLELAFNKKVNFKNHDKIRKTKYEKDYVKCRTILDQDSYLNYKFYWKERYMIQFFGEEKYNE